MAMTPAQGALHTALIEVGNDETAHSKATLIKLAGGAGITGNGIEKKERKDNLIANIWRALATAAGGDLNPPVVADLVATPPTAADPAVAPAPAAPAPALAAGGPGAPEAPRTHATGSGGVVVKLVPPQPATAQVGPPPAASGNQFIGGQQRTVPVLQPNTNSPIGPPPGAGGAFPSVPVMRPGGMAPPPGAGGSHQGTRPNAIAPVPVLTPGGLVPPPGAGGHSTPGAAVGVTRGQATPKLQPHGVNPASASPGGVVTAAQPAPGTVVASGPALTGPAAIVGALAESQGAANRALTHAQEQGNGEAVAVLADLVEGYPTLFEALRATLKG